MAAAWKRVAPPASVVGRMSREPRLAGRVAVISGGGQGFGQAIAVRFVEEGARVVLFSRRGCADTVALIASIEGLEDAGAVALEAAAGPDATAFLLGAAWLTRPSVASLVAKLEGAGEVAPTVRARDFGVALVCASPRPGGDGGDRGRLYVGCLGTWLAVSGSAGALPAGKKGD